MKYYGEVKLGEVVSMILLALEVSFGKNPYTTVEKKIQFKFKFFFKRPQSLLREARIQTE